MIYSDVSNVKITCELAGSGESESIHRDEREQPGINTKNWEPRTPPRRARKNDWIPGLPDKSIWGHIVLLPIFQIGFS